MGAFARTLRTVSYKFGLAVFAFGASVLTARNLTVGDNGVYKMVTSALVLGSTYLSGYGNYFNYGLNRLQQDRRAVTGEIMRLYRAVAVSLWGAAALLWLLSAHAAGLEFAALVAAMLPLSVLYGYTSKLIQALNEIEWLNRLNMIQVATFLAASIALYAVRRAAPGALSSGDVFLLTLGAFAASWILAALTAFAAARRLAAVPLWPRSEPTVRTQLFAYGKRTALQNLLAQLNYRSDLFLVGALNGTVAAGLYGTAVTASEVLWHVSSSIALVVYARVAREEKGGATALTERTFRYTLLVLVGAGTALMLFFPALMHLAFGPRYDRSIPPFRVLLAGTVAFGTTGLFIQYFTDQLGKVRFPLYMQSASAAANLAGCLILIPRYGIMGAAVSSTAAYVVAMILCIGYFAKVSGQPAAHLLRFTREDAELVRRLLPRLRGLHQGGK